MQVLIRQLIDEYRACAMACTEVACADEASVFRYNIASDRMRAIVDEIVSMGPDGLQQFMAVLDVTPACHWAAHHLVEKADLDSASARRCFSIVEKLIAKAEAESRPADAMGERMWLQEWQVRRGLG